MEVPPVVERAADSSSTKEEHGNASGAGDLDGEGKKPPVSPNAVWLVSSRIGGREDFVSFTGNGFSNF